MNVYNAVKSSITTRQAAELYGLTVNRKGMCKCPFHEDKNPSMKVDKRFHCFGCQADGDVIEFTSRLFGFNKKAAALKLASDFGIRYNEHAAYVPAARRPVSEEEKNSFVAGMMDFVQNLLSLGDDGQKIFDGLIAAIRAFGGTALSAELIALSNAGLSGAISP